MEPGTTLSVGRGDTDIVGEQRILCAIPERAVRRIARMPALRIILRCRSLRLHIAP